MEQQNLRAVQDRIVITPEFVENVSSSGIYLGDGELKSEGVVVAVGPEVKDVVVGDRVMFIIENGKRVNVRSDKVIVVREDDILGIME